MNENNENLFGEVISTYTRAQAIEDGFLVDVTETAKEAGFTYPTALTAHLWGKVEAPKGSTQDTMGRLWDVLWMTRYAIRSGKGGDRVVVRVKLGRRWETLVAICGPGDNAEPVLTIGYPEDD